MFDLAFVSAALHRVSYFVRFSQPQTVFPGQKRASRGVKALRAHWGIYWLEVTCLQFTSVCFAEVASMHRAEISGMLSMVEQREEDRHTRQVLSVIKKAAEKNSSSMSRFQSCVAKLAAVKVRLHCADSVCVCACVCVVDRVVGKTSCRALGLFSLVPCSGMCAQLRPDHSM